MTLDRTVAPAVSLVDDFEIAKPQKLTMKNGMPLNIIQAGSEEVVRFDIVVKGGQIDQTRPLQAFFTNRMLREGTTRYTSAQIAEKLDFYGAWLDLSSAVNYGYITLYTLNKYFDETIEVLASMVKEPIFDEEKLRLLADTAKQNYLVNEERVDVLAHKGLVSAMFGANHPLGRFARQEDYETICPDHLKSMYSKYYSSNNCTSYISGKVNDLIIRSIEKHFGDEAWGNCTISMTRNTPQAEADVRKRIVIEKDNTLQCGLKMGCFTLPRKHADFLKYKVLVTLFGGYFGSRLMSNIREDKGYTYGIGSVILSYPNASLLTIGTETANEHVENVIKEVYYEMDRLQTEKVSDKELDMVKNYMLGDICRSYESAFSLSDAWIFIESSHSDEDYFKESIQAIRDITTDDIINLSQKYFIQSDLKEVIAGKTI